MLSVSFKSRFKPERFLNMQAQLFASYFLFNLALAEEEEVDEEVVEDEEVGT